MGAPNSVLLERTIDLRDAVATTRDTDTGESESLTGLNLSAEQVKIKEAIMTRALDVSCVRDILAHFMGLGDTFTAAHQLRVGELLAADGAYRGDDPREVTARTVAGLVHDVGKCLMQEVVHSPGPLTAAGRETIRWHPKIGAMFLESCGAGGNIVQMVGNHHAHQVNNPCYVFAEVVPAEEEPGYKPDTITGAQLLAVADFYDALRSPRPYRPTALAAEKTLAIMGEELTVPDNLLDRFAGLVLPRFARAA